MNFQVLLPEMLKASITTLQIFFLTILFSVPLGVLVCFGSISRAKWITFPTKLYILLMRGTPLMLQMMFVFYGIKPVLGVQPPRFSAAIIAFSLNYAAYFAEIFRGGILSIPRGQHEAAKVLGFTKSQAFFKIIVPQVCKHITPAMGNEFITLVKDTALAQTIVVVEIMRVTEKFASVYVSSVPFAIAAMFYLLMNGIVTKLFSNLEKRFNYYR